MNFHEEIEFLLYSINCSNNEQIKSHYYQKLEAILENYMKSKAEPDQRTGPAMAAWPVSKLR